MWRNLGSVLNHLHGEVLTLFRSRGVAIRCNKPVAFMSPI